MVRFLKSGLPKIAAMPCMITSPARLSTSLENAVPMMNPSARSNMFPLKANALNSAQTDRSTVASSADMDFSLLPTVYSLDTSTG
jgi:hypothetical protein